MNILGLVFSLLLILSYGFFACWDKQTGSRRLRTTYLGHQKVNRQFLRHYESELYQNLPTAKEPSQGESIANKEPSDSPVPTKPDLNAPCAQINLLPLIQEGKEEHPFLYEITAKLLRTFYKEALFDGKPRLEYRFLDALLKSAKAALQKNSFALEKLQFADPDLQMLHYKMLKGTKQSDLPNHVGYPSLLDYLKYDALNEKICLFHAHPDLITVFFGPQVAQKLYSEMHKEQAPPLTQELIEHLCSEAHIIALDPEIFNLLKLGRSNHEGDLKRTLVESDETSHISLRKNIYLKHG